MVASHHSPNYAPHVFEALPRSLTFTIFSMSRFLTGFVRRLQVLRYLSNEALRTSGERSLSSILQKKFPEAADIQVKDISGGCGAMYEIYVQSSIFKNLSRVQQHRLVNEALKAEIQDMHGIRITTALPGDK
uniref:BolA-like protein 3 n=1 Tax=Amblyomma maculatum TaxID=34609 RepID=G3MRI0_AMBMU